MVNHEQLSVIPAKDEVKKHKTCECATEMLLLINFKYKLINLQPY